MSFEICVIPGDGIGQEVIPQAVRVLQALSLECEFTYAEAGYECYKKRGTPLPKETIRKLEDVDVALFGAVTTPPNIPDYSSVILELRQRFDLYANLRPLRSYPIDRGRENVDIVIVRENTEGLYSGNERVEKEGTQAISEKVVTSAATRRIVEYACEYAVKHNREKVTIVHKANVLRETDGLFLRVGRQVAKQYPTLNVDDMLVDAMAMRLITHPEDYDVIVTSNLFGDILSDETAGLIGGLGFAPSGNIGETKAIFEPVHGSAPDIAGEQIANPVAAILSAKMLLEYMGKKNQAQTIEKGLQTTLREKIFTKDVGGNYTTKQFTDELLSRL